jgi:hypothetical protein
MAHPYDEIAFLVEEHRRDLLADAALARRAAADRPARTSPAPPRLRASAAALLYALAVRLDRRYAVGKLALTR